MIGFLELTQSKSQGRGTTLVNIEAIDRIRRMYVAANIDEQSSTILTLRNGETIHVQETYEEILALLARLGDVSGATQDLSIPAAWKTPLPKLEP